MDKQKSISEYSSVLAELANVPLLPLVEIERQFVGVPDVLLSNSDPLSLLRLTSKKILEDSATKLELKAMAELLNEMILEVDALQDAKTVDVQKTIYKHLKPRLVDGIPQNKAIEKKDGPRGRRFDLKIHIKEKVYLRYHLLDNSLSSEDKFEKIANELFPNELQNRTQCQPDKVSTIKSYYRDAKKLFGDDPEKVIKHNVNSFKLLKNKK